RAAKLGRPVPGGCRGERGHVTGAVDGRQHLGEAPGGPECRRAAGMGDPRLRGRRAVSASFPACLSAGSAHTVRRSTAWRRKESWLPVDHHNTPARYDTLLASGLTSTVRYVAMSYTRSWYLPVSC